MPYVILKTRKGAKSYKVHTNKDGVMYIMKTVTRSGKRAVRRVKLSKGQIKRVTSHRRKASRMHFGSKGRKSVRKSTRRSGKAKRSVRKSTRRSGKAKRSVRKSTRRSRSIRRSRQSRGRMLFTLKQLRSIALRKGYSSKGISQSDLADFVTCHGRKSKRAGSGPRPSFCKSKRMKNVYSRMRSQRIKPRRSRR